MSKLDKILEKILRGTSDANIDFEDLRQLLNNFGFDERIRGSHHIYTKSDVVEIINLQAKGSKAISGKASSDFNLEIQTSR
jgi:predicted RNA binding protein YcfA (HicA-like mRNA interferase family)